MVTEIKKRDGRVEPFNKHKIIEAIGHAMKRAGQNSPEIVEKIADEIANFPADILEVEQIQDMVEQTKRC